MEKKRPGIKLSQTNRSILNTTKKMSPSQTLADKIIVETHKNSNLLPNKKWDSKSAPFQVTLILSSSLQNLSTHEQTARSRLKMSIRLGYG